jgi:hypothetical protein
MAGAELRAAIKGRNVVEFRYRGSRRVAHPHAIFIASTGTHCLDAVQVGGVSSSGELPGWRRFDLNGVDAVQVRAECFEVADDFEARARDYKRGIVVAAVDQ